MDRYSSVEETKQDFINHMGEKLGSVFFSLYNEVIWLYIKWDEYIELFGTKPSRIELLNNTAPIFFRIVQDNILDDTLLHIVRLTDRSRSNRKFDNLTIKCLPNFIKDERLIEDIRKLIKTVNKKTDFCLDWRNRRIAHRDLKLSLDAGAKPLKPASRDKIEEALESISKIMNLISGHYMDTQIEFRIGKQHGGALTLLYVLNDGLQAEIEQKKRIESGKYKPGDFDTPDL